VESYPNEGDAQMPAMWERIYVRAIYVLVAIPVAVALWYGITSGGWRFRALFIFTIGWNIAARLAAKWIASKWRAFVNGWLARGRLHVFYFNLLAFGFPLGIASYLAPSHLRLELLTMIPLMSLLSLLFMRSPSRNTDSSVRAGGPA
jgi:hypothetical protein